MPGVGPVVGVEMPGVVPDVVLAGWLGVGVLPETLVLVSEVAVVSAGVHKVSAEAAVGAGVVGGGTVGEEALPVPRDVLDLSGVEAPVSGLEGGTVAVVVEAVVGSNIEVSVGVGEAGRVGDTVTVTSVTVLPAKRWQSEARKGGGERPRPRLCWERCSIATSMSSPSYASAMDHQELGFTVLRGSSTWMPSVGISKAGHVNPPA